MLKLRKFSPQPDPSDEPEKHTSRKEASRNRGSHIFKKYALPLIGFLLLTALLLSILVVSVSATMVSVEKKRIVSASDAAVLNEEKPFDCILILGAGLRPDGSPSDILHDRVTTGVALHHALGGTPLLMSGDRTGDYNEVEAMRHLAVSLGVSDDRIVSDFKGYSTYESILRAKEIYGAKRILIVTQTYHLYRARYLAEALDLEAYGVSADLRPYRRMVPRELREMLARFKDLFQGGQQQHIRYDEPSVPLP